MPREITAFSNPLVKRVRSLRDKKHRRDAGLFLAEGLRILTEAREAGHLPAYLFFAKGHDGHPLAQELIAATEAAGGEVIQTDNDILSKLSGKDNPGAVVGVYAELSTDLARIDQNSTRIEGKGRWLHRTPAALPPSRGVPVCNRGVIELPLYQSSLRRWGLGL